MLCRSNVQAAFAAVFVAVYPERLPHPATSPDPPSSPHSETFRDRESFSRLLTDTNPRGTVSGPLALAPFANYWVSTHSSSSS
jgi:hypothetical protein